MQASDILEWIASGASHEETTLAPSRQLPDPCYANGTRNGDAPHRTLFPVWEHIAEVR